MRYKSWADYRTKWRMVKSGDEVEKVCSIYFHPYGNGTNKYVQFLVDLKQRLHPLGVQECETLLQLKADELKAKGEPFNGELYVWDYQYYKHLYLKKSPHLRLDHNHIKEYFPASTVIPEILEIFQTFFGVSFHEVKDSQTWHPDVQLFAVWNADAKDELDFVGYCYLDLFQHGVSSYVYAFFLPIYLLSFLFN
jgi:Zn-dependent oligopeptidase